MCRGGASAPSNPVRRTKKSADYKIIASCVLSQNVFRDKKYKNIIKRRKKVETKKPIKIILEVPTLILVIGTPGCGKTVLSLGFYDDNGIKKENGSLDFLSAFYINKDDINDGFSAERTGEHYSSVVRKGTYDAIDNIIRHNLKLNNSIWVDATYWTEVKNPDWAYRYLLMVQQYNYKLKIIRCVSQESIIKERLIKRGYSRDRYKLENWEKFIKDEPIYLDVPYGGMILDRSDSNLKKDVSLALNFLQE